MNFCDLLRLALDAISSIQMRFFPIMTDFVNNVCKFVAEKKSLFCDDSARVLNSKISIMCLPRKPWETLSNDNDNSIAETCARKWNLQP